MKSQTIKTKEINDITKHSPPREKALFTIMRQSGLQLNTIAQLKIKNIERILEPNTPIPCRINTPQEKHPFFIGEEAVKHLKRYLRTRKDLTPESLLFTARNEPQKQINVKRESTAFTTLARRISPSTEATLHSLTDFYKLNTDEYRGELKRYKAPKDSEIYGDLYEEKALPYLEIEDLTTNELHQLKTQVRQLNRQLSEIRDKILPKEPPPEYQEEMDRLTEEHEKEEQYFREHPEELDKLRKKQRERQDRYNKYLEEHPEEAKQIQEQMDAEAEQMEEFNRYSLEERVKELQSKLNELIDIVTTSKHAKRKNISNS